MTTTETDLARTTSDDLEWWLERVHELDWVFAVTYAKRAPHEYVNAGRTPGFTHDDSVRAAHVIRTFGQPGKFFATTRIYLEDGRGWKYWDMAGDDLSVSNIINRGRVEHVYGVQTAPRTWSGMPSRYDGIATWWDSHYGASEEERRGILEIIRGLGDFRKRRVLDIGCGTGLALDLGITEPERYVGIDPSQGMLNSLVSKHPYVAGVQAMTFGGALQQRVLGGTRFDLVLGLGGVGSYLNESELNGATRHAGGPIVMSCFADGHAPVIGDISQCALEGARGRVVEWAQEFGGSTERVGRFDVTVVMAIDSNHRQDRPLQRKTS